jgi:predicted phage tail protein
MSLTKVTFHGNLADKLDQNQWELEVESIAEAMHAVDIMSDRKLSFAIIENEKQNVKYKVLVDGKNCLSKPVNSPEEALTSELCIKNKMETIDIVPVLEGAGGGGDGDSKDIMMVVGGALMLGAGFAMKSPMMTQLGLFAVLSGMANLLAEPPEFEDFREIQQVNKRESYLFNGPINTYNPGGPVPVGYGRMLVGSLAIGFSQFSEDKKIYVRHSDDTETWYP